jgi:hypothetical protein
MASTSAPRADAFHDQDNVCVGTNALRVVDSRSLPGRLRDLGSTCAELAFTAEGPAAAPLPLDVGSLPPPCVTELSGR